MEKTYEHQLDEIVGALPDGGCRVALVPTIATDQAAALASDLAQLVGRNHSGHTLLLSVEGPGAALDHEIGVEGGAGLTEILAGTSTLAKVAAHGRARGFVYVPAGAGAAEPAALLGSSAFDKLTGAASSRGGVVLLFVPEDVLRTSRLPGVDGVVWLGPGPAPDRVPSGWTTLGFLRPPGAGGAGSSAAPQAAAASAAEAESSASPEGRSLPRRALVVALVVTTAAAIALGVYVVSRADEPNSFLPENDSLWLAPTDTVDTEGD